MPKEVFVLIIISIVALFLIIRGGLKHDKDIRIAKYAARTPHPDGDRDILAAKVQRIEQRLAVVERIAIDPSQRLAAEIDDLSRIESHRERTEA